jgi:DNA-binding NtrC family response regulator
MPGKTILAVDDEPDMREVVRRILERKGYSVLLADSVEAALAVLREHADEICLLLTDVRMPSGAGSELSAAAREIMPSLRVLYMSGYSAHHAIAEGMIEPGSAVVEKPFTPSTLVEAVQTALFASL